MQVRYVYKWQMRLLNENFTFLRFFHALVEVDWNPRVVVAFVFYGVLGFKCVELMTKTFS